MYDQSIDQSKQRKYCITKVNKDVMSKVLYYKGKQSIVFVLPKYCITKVNKDVMTKVLHYKNKQSIVLQK